MRAAGRLPPTKQKGDSFSVSILAVAMLASPSTSLLPWGGFFLLSKAGLSNRAEADGGSAGWHLQCIAGYRAEIQGHVIHRLHAPCCVPRSSPVVVLLPPTWAHAVFLPSNFWASLASGTGEGKKNPKSFAPLQEAEKRRWWMENFF